MLPPVHRMEHGQLCIGYTAVGAAMVPRSQEDGRRAAGAGGGATETGVVIVGTGKSKKYGRGSTEFTGVCGNGQSAELATAGLSRRTIDIRAGLWGTHMGVWMGLEEAHTGVSTGEPSPGVTCCRWTNNTIACTPLPGDLQRGREGAQVGEEGVVRCSGEGALFWTHRALPGI